MNTKQTFSDTQKLRESVAGRTAFQEMLKDLQVESKCPWTVFKSISKEHQ